jgi:endogenous inhibitor of DNA gyrase (YacG/DUF329 family)
MTHVGSCPTCAGPRKSHPENQSFPFCSPRCKLADLGHWLDGKYAIPGEPALDEEQDRSARFH